MKGFINGEIVELTEEQIEEIKKIPNPQIITTNERLATLEKAIADIAAMFFGGIK